ncbi:MAG: hypothetical protein KF893_22990 [Caldilineaceae bacterium]|nr:hypothetical protein [Caldilineaceae bacterium]
MKNLCSFVLAVSLFILTACVTAVDDALPFDELPEIVIGAEVELVASPAHPTAYLGQGRVPAGGQVSVIGSVPDSAWLLVRYESTIGWLPAFYSQTNIGNLSAALMVEGASAACSRYLDTIFIADEPWQSNSDESLFVIGSVFRPQMGDGFDDATLDIVLEGKGVAVASDYVHVQLTDASAIILFVFTLQGLDRNSTVRFDLADLAKETLEFQAAFFSNTCPDTPGHLPIGKLRVPSPIDMAATVAGPTPALPSVSASASAAEQPEPTPVIIRPVTEIVPPSVPAYPGPNLGGLLTSDTRLTAANSPYVVRNFVTVDEGVTLYLEPGTIVKLDTDMVIGVKGSLRSLGTEDNPVIFTSLKDDSVGGDTNEDRSATSPTAGDWGQIFFAPTSSNSIIEYTVIHYGGLHQARGWWVGRSWYGYTSINGDWVDIYPRPGDNNVVNYGGSIRLDGASPTIRNTTITNTEIGIVMADGAAPSLDGIEYRAVGRQTARQ